MKTLIVILGPTAVGKTDLSIKTALRYGSPIISCDSRQMYRGMKIGTAAPSDELLNSVKHYFIGNLELSDYYSAAMFEEEFMALSSSLFKEHDTLVMCGGSMMYIDAVCNGIDEIPTISDDIRAEAVNDLECKGLDFLCQELKERDPALYNTIDLKNHKRVVHAIEVCRQTGRPFSELRTNSKKERPFNIIKIGLNIPRELLFECIAKRTDAMIAEGLIEESRGLLPYRNLNSLNTVGYKEIFAYFDGIFTLEEAIEKIKRNTRVYAKKQLTWFKRDKDISWFDPSDTDAVFKHIDSLLKSDAISTCL
ncbi:MAG: tRNA (adenosine(37)-N6)-dimethylallyltransferase MiaA [Bacteroidales bacterium]|nr:tRNA (adenosine(37)-N6)-dimethylallyltransferase MiaA [Bacteroidales bacterium]